LDGTAISGFEPALRETLQRAIELDRSLGRVKPLYVWLDKRSSTAVVERVTQVVPKPVEARFFVVGPERNPKDYEKALRNKDELKAFDAEHARLPATERARLIANANRRAIGSACPGLIKTFGEQATLLDPTRRQAFLVKHLPEALAECECELPNPDLFEHVTTLALGGDQRATGWAPAFRVKQALKKP
jgi:hypothetical protein